MIDFLKYRTFFALYSILTMGAFVGTYYYKKSVHGQAYQYSVDFTGGTQVLFKFSQPVSDVELKDILDKQGWTGSVMRNFSATETLVRVKEFASDITGFADRMRQVVVDGLKDKHISVEILSKDSVSGGIGKDLWWKSFMALLIALSLMLVYIWFRFWSISYGVGAVVSLAHDAVMLLFLFLILDKEISINFIGAILTVLGYSINDTIVIFTKIRQNIKTMRNTPLVDIVNISINETLRRTLLTSFATTLVVVALIVLGGETLRDFSLALLVGIVYGTYSSIYIASPVMLLLNKDAK
jgi:preprotein translocase subunit SecF